jgi:nifR3 family TIM-barrel protein
MFWDKLKKPFFALAPMHDVTDVAFRETIAHFGKPDVLFTEFVSVDGLCHEKSREKMKRFYLQFTEMQRPIVAQIWGNNPEHFFEAAKYVAALGFDGIDINMGCPDKSVVKQGGGAALILDPKRAVEVIEATKKGAGDLPVSVKTRIGFDQVSIYSWILELISARPAAITIHGRTKKELSRVPAHWDLIGKVAEIAQGSGIYILGNGDVSSKSEGLDLAKKYNLDGIMVGRAVLGNPWFFSEKGETEHISAKKRIEALEYHAKKFDEYFKDIKRFAHFKKHIKGYLSDFKGAKELRAKVMEAKNFSELKDLLDKYAGRYI